MRALVCKRKLSYELGQLELSLSENGALHRDDGRVAPFVHRIPELCPKSISRSVISKAGNTKEDVPPAPYNCGRVDSWQQFPRHQLSDTLPSFPVSCVCVRGMSWGCSVGL